MRHKHTTYSLGVEEGGGGGLKRGERSCFMSCVLCLKEFCPGLQDAKRRTLYGVRLEKKLCEKENNPW